MTLSEESGIGYRKTHLVSPTSAWILHSTPYFFILVFPIAFYDRSRMTGRYLLPLKNRTHLCLDSYRSRWSGMVSHSLLQRRFAPRKVVLLLPRQAGTAYGLYSFLLKKVIQYHIGTPFTRAVILERCMDSE